MKKTKKSNTQAMPYKQTILRQRPRWWRTMYHLGCFRDLGVQWKRQNDGVVKPVKWELKMRLWNPFTWVGIIGFIVYAIGVTVWNSLYGIYAAIKESGFDFWSLLKSIPTALRNKVALKC